MVDLKSAVETAQTDLKAMEGVNLLRPLGMLSGVLSSLPEGGGAGVWLAKDACEAIVDCAHSAQEAGDNELAEELLRVNRALSPVVAACYPLLGDSGGLEDEDLDP